MALIRCPECGREISQYAEKCPGCGWPVRLDADGQTDARRQRPAESNKTKKAKKTKRAGISAPRIPRRPAGKRVVHKTKYKGNVAGTAFISVIITLLVLAMLAVCAYFYFFIYGEEDNDYDQDMQTKQIEQTEELPEQTEQEPPDTESEPADENPSAEDTQVTPSGNVPGDTAEIAGD